MFVILHVVEVELSPAEGLLCVTFFAREYKKYLRRTVTEEVLDQEYQAVGVAFVW